MPNFTPSGTIRIGRVPFDNSYASTVMMEWGSEAAQASAFAAWMVDGIAEGAYTYMRVNNSIRVNYNAEGLYTYNYVMYQNSNYGSKWFYAFIVGCNYVNENCTELVLELDVIHTWWFDVTLCQCLVEREHVYNDSLDAHINPEPEMPLESSAQNVGYIGDLEDYNLIIQTTDKPVQVGPLWIASETVKGGFYHNILSGAKMYKFSPGEIDAGLDMLEHLNSAGVGGSVSGLFMFPAAYTPTAGSDYGIPTGTQPISNTYSLTRPTNLHGYTPKNNKLFTFPYCYARLRHANDASVDLRYELWADGYQVRVTVPIDSSSTCFAIPQGYQGIADNTAAMLTFGIDIHCSWVMDSFANWLGQNAVAMALGAAGGGAVLGRAAMSGVKGARAGYDRGYSAMVTNPNIKTGASAQNTLVGGTKKGAYNAIEPHRKELGYTAAAAGMGVANIARQAAQPNVLVGSASGNALAAVSFQDIRTENITLLPEFAEIVDNFFSMYGYQVDVIKVPEIFSRPSWNYVKTAYATHIGNVPSDDMSKFNQIFDNGITFWHTWDTANYSLDNYAPIR